MADRIALSAAPRGVTGKRVRHLRRQGILPANIFGKGLESVAVEVDAREFALTMKTHGSRSLFDLTVAGEAKPRPVVIRSMTRQGGTGDLTHVDFYQVDPRRPILTSIVVQFIGESPAVKDLAGTLVTMVDTVQVRCLPLAIPDGIDADLGKLVSFDVSLTAGDLNAPEGVEIVTDPSVPLATVMAPRLRLEVDEEASAEDSGEEASGDE